MLTLDRIYAGHRFKAVTRNIDVEIAPGEKFIISGCAKSGKTTLLQTAAGIIPPVSGCVFFDFLPITEFSRRELGHRLCYIPQDIFPEEKIRRISNALTDGFEYILADEPFAFLSEYEQAELTETIFSCPGCSFLITENSAKPVYREGFSTFHLAPRQEKAAPKDAAYM